ncbi:MAG: peptidyl-prolyl cis-trans isomerase [Bacteroidaceae bacterium]|nr:peptidyl-prolyl cis-trans isomerase [Bacteroidaceae bacterium]
MKQAVTVVFPVLIVLCTAIFVSCEEEIMHRGRTPLVSVNNEFLYVEDVQRFYAANPQADSARYVEEYVNRWIEEAVFYNVALRNVPSSREINKLVESYKRSLVLNIYQEGLIEQHLRSNTSSEEIQAFYEANSPMFEVDEPIMRGLFLKVSKDAPKLSSLRKWYKSRAIEDLEKLEKYSFTNNVLYDYFAETWNRISDVAAKMPITDADLLQRLLHSSAVEFSDNEYVYFVSADSIINRGELKPVELVSDEIRVLLVNTKKADFIKNKKRVLLDEAVKRGDIKYYSE